MVCNTLIHHTTDISIKQKGKSKSGYNSCFARQQILYYRKHAIVGIKLCILLIYYVRGQFYYYVMLSLINGISIVPRFSNIVLQLAINQNIL